MTTLRPTRARPPVAAKPGLRATTSPMPAADPIALFAAAIEAGLEAALWLQPSEGRWFVGVGRAWAVVSALSDEILARCPEVRRLTPAGDMRRVEPIVDGIVVVALVDDVDAAMSCLLRLQTIGDPVRESATTLSIDLRQATVDMRLATADSYGTVLFEATGSPAHVEAIMERRRDRSACADEDAVYAGADLPFVPPELRQGLDGVAAAASGSLPVLVERAHIRGDLHMHSTFSDGQDPIAMMVAKCHSLGYEYIAITDHSENASASRTLRVNQIARQRAEIDRLRERYPEMTIFHGVEVDILENGRLDFNDRLLEHFDLVALRQHGHTLERLADGPPSPPRDGPP